MDRFDFFRKYMAPLGSWSPWSAPPGNHERCLDQRSDPGREPNHANADRDPQENPPADSHFPLPNPIHNPPALKPFGLHGERALPLSSSPRSSSSSTHEVPRTPSLDPQKVEAYHRAYYREAARPIFFDESVWTSSDDSLQPNFGPEYSDNPEDHNLCNGDKQQQPLDDYRQNDTGSESGNGYLSQEDEDDDGAMARSRAGPRRRVADLKGILTPAERDDLASLILRILDRMGHQITDAFDSRPVTPVETDNPNHGWIALQLQNRENISLSNKPLAYLAEANKPNNSTSNVATPSKTTKDKTDGRPSNGSIRSSPKAHQIIEKEEHEAMTPQLQELKKELSVVYKKWQTFVTNRIRDVKVTELPQSAQRGDKTAAGAGRGGRWSNRVGRGDRRGGRGRGGFPNQPGPVRPPPPSEIDPQLFDRFRPCPTMLWQLSLEKRKIILHTMLLLILSLEEYNAYARLLMLHLTSSLSLPLKALQESEISVAQTLGKTAGEFNPDEIVKEKAEENKNTKKIKVGLAGLAGAALVGVTGGLAAPLVAAGVGTMLGGLGLGATAAAGLLGTVAESGVVVGALFGIYGAKASVKSMESYARDIQDFAFIPLHGQLQKEIKDTKEIHHQDRRLRVVICISGWLTKEEDVVNPWRCIGDQAEVYALRWELTALMNMGNSLETVIKSTAWSVAKKEIISRTIFASLMEGLWPLGLLKINKIIDNPWSMGMVRAEKAGLVLADTIQRKLQGGRPISLIGYSLAARAIYTCLMVLAERRQFGLVDSVVLIGTPAPSETRVWLTLKSVVAGRLVNVFSENDYILGFLYRMSNIQFGIAGLQEVRGVRGVENYDVSNLVSGHLRYQYLIGTILKNIGWEDVDLEQVAREEAVLREMDQNYNKDKHKMAEQDSTDMDMDKEVARIEKELKEKNEWTHTQGRSRGGGGGGRRGGRRNNHRARGEPKTGRSTIQT